MKKKMYVDPKMLVVKIAPRVLNSTSPTGVPIDNTGGTVGDPNDWDAPLFGGGDDDDVDW